MQNTGKLPEELAGRPPNEKFKLRSLHTVGSKNALPWDFNLKKSLVGTFVPPVLDAHSLAGAL